ncbi:MAG: hypothetical protein ACYC9L_03100 [Sulfuricaulis sp.]
MLTLLVCLALPAWAIFLYGSLSEFVPEKTKPASRPWLNGLSLQDENLEKLPRLEVFPKNAPVVAEPALAPLSSLAVAPQVPTMNVDDVMPMNELGLANDDPIRLGGRVDPQEWIVTENQISDWD